MYLCAELWREVVVMDIFVIMHVLELNYDLNAMVYILITKASIWIMVSQIISEEYRTCAGH